MKVSVELWGNMPTEYSAQFKATPKALAKSWTSKAEKNSVEQ